MSPRALKRKITAMKTQSHKHAETFNIKVEGNLHGKKVHGVDLGVANKPLIDKLYKKRRLEQMNMNKTSVSPIRRGTSEEED